MHATRTAVMEPPLVMHPVPAEMPAPARPRRRRPGGRFKVLVVIILLVVGSGVYGAFFHTTAFDDDTTRNEVNEITASGALGALVVRLGDCVNVPYGAQEVETVEGVPCHEPHDAQVYGKFEITHLAEYNDEAVRAAADQGCLERWRPMIGTAFEDDVDRDIVRLFPTPDSWRLHDDRSVTCLVAPVHEGQKLTGSSLLTSPS